MCEMGEGEEEILLIEIFISRAIIIAVAIEIEDEPCILLIIFKT
jgi:hypothetical protein